MLKVAEWLDRNDGESETNPDEPDPTKRKSWYDRMKAGAVSDFKGVESVDSPDGQRHIFETINQYRMADSNKKVSGIIHFNLNNLLAELTTNTARVMLWRPIEQP